MGGKDTSVILKSGSDEDSHVTITAVLRSKDSLLSPVAAKDIGGDRFPSAVLRAGCRKERSSR